MSSSSNNKNTNEIREVNDDSKSLSSVENAPFDYNACVKIGAQGTFIANGMRPVQFGAVGVSGIDGLKEYGVCAFDLNVSKVKDFVMYDNNGKLIKDPETLPNQLQLMREEYAKEKAGLEDLKGQYITLSQNIEAVRNNVQQYSAVPTQINSLQLENNDERSTINALKEQYNSMSQNLDIVRGSLEQISAINEQLKSVTDEHNKERNDLTSHSSQYKSLVEGMASLRELIVQRNANPDQIQ
ncbi:MAG: hypothetical protein RL059_136 [Bacteroidota bacterium]